MIDFDAPSSSSSSSSSSTILPSVDVHKISQQFSIDQETVNNVDAMLKNNGSSPVVVVNPPLNSKQRLNLERFAKKLNLNFELSGKGKPMEKSVTLSLPTSTTSSSSSTSASSSKHSSSSSTVSTSTSSSSQQPVRILYKKGYIYAEGYWVEQSVRPFLKCVDKAWIERRKNRDGKSGEHHVTLVAKHELATLRGDRKPEDIVEMFVRQITKDRDKRSKSDSNVTPFRTLGLGVASEDGINNCTTFAVIDWPAAQQVRDELNLKHHDFHATIGFKRNDIHDVRKDATTLISKSKTTTTSSSSNNNDDADDDHAKKNNSKVTNDDNDDEDDTDIDDITTKLAKFM